MKDLNIKKVVIASALAVSLVTAAGAGSIVDDEVDHTKELCPITKVLNLIPFYDFNATPFGIKHHQMKKVKETYEKKDIDDFIIYYGKLTKKLEKYLYTDANKYVDDSGKIKYEKPGKDYELVEETDEYAVYRKKVTYDVADGTGIIVEYDKKNGIGNYQKKDVLRVK